jgi:hypothetical protein
VKGTLVCDTDGDVTGNSTLADTPLVPLSAQRDAEFSGNVGPLPSACSLPDIASLVRISSTPTNRWIANGAVRTPSAFLEMTFQRPPCVVPESP